MPTQKRHYRSYVQLHVPTKDKDDNELPRTLVDSWIERAKQIFQENVKGYYISPFYRVEGAYHSDGGKWIEEPNEIIKAFAPTEDCRRLIEAMENGFIEEMGVALKQESIGVESSLEGFVKYTIK